jgi:hypothetical protein
MKKTDPRYPKWIRALRAVHMTKPTYWPQLVVSMELRPDFTYCLRISNGENNWAAIYNISQFPTERYLIDTGYNMISGRWFPEKPSSMSPWWFRNNKDKHFIQAFIKRIRDQYLSFKRQNAQAFIDMKAERKLESLNRIRRSLCQSTHRALDRLDADEVVRLVNETIVSRAMEG